MTKQKLLEMLDEKISLSKKQKDYADSEKKYLEHDRVVGAFSRGEISGALIALEEVKEWVEKNF